MAVDKLFISTNIKKKQKKVLWRVTSDDFTI